MEPETPVAAPPESGASNNIEDAGSMNEKVAHLMAEIAKHPDMPLPEKKKRVMAAFNLLDDGAADAPVEAPIVPMEDDMDKEREEERKEEEKEQGEEKKMEESIKILKASTDSKHRELAESLVSRLTSLRDMRRDLKLRKETDSYNGAKQKARTLCESSALPKTLITEVLIESMARRRNEKAMKAVLEDRLALVNIKTPIAAPGFQVSKKPAVAAGASGRKESSDVKSFVESVNKRS